MENNSCLIFNDFLTPEVNADLYEHAIQQQAAFEHTRTAGQDGKGALNEKWRHSNSLPPKYFMEYYKMLAKKIKAQNTDIGQKLGLPPFEFDHIEMHLTSHNEGEFYKPHIDNGSGVLKNRVMTFVYYFHSLPRQFSGGQLLFLRNQPKPLIVEPNNNSIVFFNSSLVHAVHPVSCPSKQFEHGRFTLNGWIWKKETPVIETTDQA
jgi:Rps23 Pro-64 3,4-dihydroxylase Tpa1-like proline 4-hydroxylase